MRCVWLLLLTLLLVAATPVFHRSAAAQAPAAQAQSAANQVAAEPAVRHRTPEAGKLLFPCYAKETHPPKPFSALWDPRAVNEPDEERVTVIIGFDDPDPQFPFDCVGEPLQIIVPNGQIVNLVRENWKEGCTPTITLTPAVADSTVADLLTLISKVGVVGFDGGGQARYYELPPLKNKVLNVTVVCTITKTDKLPARKLTQTVTITYQNPPRIAASAGLLVSTEGVKSYTILTTKTGVGSNGADTSHTTIGISGNSSAQVIPSGFVNLYWAGSRKLNLSSQFGVGVNPNLSTPRIEFFAAPVGVAWHDFYFAPGIHIGQHEVLTGGFAVGDVVSGLSKPPIAWRYRAGLAFSLSYNLKPLIRGAAPSPSK
jgi:hypothetical protein